MRDIDIRSALHNKILCHYLRDGESLIVDELKVCNGRSVADVAVINGTLSGYEIKSERDNLARLPDQVDSYGKVFDFMTIVTNHKHLPHISTEIPDWWGIWLIQEKDGEIVKTEIRTALINSNSDSFSLAQFLWKDELTDLIARKGLDVKMKNKRKWLLWEYVSRELNIQELKDEVRYYMKKRDGWKISRFKVEDPSFLPCGG
jgi:hypothetical protein